MTRDLILLLHSILWALIAMFAGVFYADDLLGPETNTWLFALFVMSNGFVTNQLFRLTTKNGQAGGHA